MITVNLMSKMKQDQQAVESLKSSSVFGRISRALVQAVESESQLQIELVNGNDPNAAEIYTEIRCPEGKSCEANVRWQFKNPRGVAWP